MNTGILAQEITMGFFRRHSLWLLFVFILVYPKHSPAADVVLGWDANTELNLAGYKIYYGPAAGVYSTPVTVGAAQTTYTVTGLQSGTWYFAVTAFDTSGAESGYSNEASQVVDATPPIVSSLRAINIVSSGATVTWTTNEPADSQVEYGRTTAYGSLTTLNATMVTAHSQALPGLAANTVYHCRVLSKDSAGNIAVSGDLSFTTSASPDSTPPVISGVTSGRIDSSSALIAWTTNEVSDSQVQYGLTTSYGQATPVESAGVTSHAQTLTGLNPGSLYHFRVLSRDSAANLSVSGDYSFATAASTTAVPGFVQANALLVTTGTSVSVGLPTSNTAGNLIVAYVVWDNSSPVSLSDSMGNSYISAIGPTRYSGDRTSAQIFYARNIAGGMNTVTATFSTAITAWGILYVHEYSGMDALSPLESASAGAGSSSIMNSGSVTTTSPNALLFAGGESSGSVTLGSNGYTLRSNQYGNLTEDWIAGQPGTYSAAATQNASAWILQLAAFRAATLKPADTTAPQMTSLTATGVTSSGATITWTTDESSDSQVEYGPTTAYGNSTPVNLTMVMGHSVALGGLTPGTTYHYRAKSKDSAGNLAVSADFTFTTAPITTAVPKFVQKKEVSIVSGTKVSVKFPYSNTAGNLIVAYIVWDNSSPVSLSDSMGNSYISAIGPTRYSGDRTNAQIFYARNIRGGSNTVTVTFSTPVTSWGILYAHEYSGLDKTAPLDSATAGSGSSSIIRTGPLTTTAPNALLFAGGESSGTVTLRSKGFTVRSTASGNITEDRIAGQPGTYTAAITQNSTACILQLVAFKAAVQQTNQTIMALPLITSAASAADSYVGVAVVNPDSTPATLTFTAVDPSGNEFSGRGISNPAVRTLNPGEQLRIVDRALFGDGIADVKSEGWIRIETSSSAIRGQYAAFDKDLSAYRGAPIATEPLRTIVTPEMGEPARARFTAVNTTPESAVVSFDMVASDGTVRASTDRLIDPRGQLTVDSMASLFGSLVPDTTDYIRVRSSAALHVLETAELNGDSVLSNGLDQGAGAHILYAMQYEPDPAAGSALSVVNLDSRDGIVSFRLIGDDGRQIGDPKILTIPSNGKITVRDPNFFDVTDTANETQGYVEVRSADIRLAGTVKWESSRGVKSASVVPLVSRLQDSAILSNMVQEELFSTAITLLNPGDNDVSAKIELYTSEGSLVASAADGIPPHQRTTRSMREYFPGIAGSHWTSGYVTIRTDLPVAVSSTIAKPGSEILTLIPPQQIE